MPFSFLVLRMMFLLVHPSFITAAYSLLCACPLSNNTMASFGLAAATALESASSPASSQQQQQQPGFDSNNNNNNNNNVDASTPWVAAADGNLNQLQTSLSILNLPISAADANGYTLLQAAASYGQDIIVQWLLHQTQAQSQSQEQAQSDDTKSTISQLLQAVDADGDSALHYASTVSVAQLLINHGSIALAQIQNAEGLTPLQAKQQELQELREEKEEEGDDDDEDIIQLQRLVAYLSDLQNVPQDGGH
jgi:ankyrin repeat protein